MNSHASGSRKNAVTLIRMVLNSAANSSELACSTSRYSSKRVEAGLVHPVAHPAHQRGALVAGEVEAARVAHVAQQGLERLVCS